MENKAALIDGLVEVSTYPDLTTCINLYCLSSESSLSLPSLSEYTLSLLPLIQQSIDQSVHPIPLSLINRLHKVIISLLHDDSPLLDQSIYLPFLTTLVSSCEHQLSIDDA